MLSHLAGAFKERPLFDPKRRSGKVRLHPSAREQLDPLRGAHRATQGSIDRDSADFDFCRYLRPISDDQLASRPDLALETAVDAEGLLKGELSVEVAPPVDESVERGSVGFDSHLPLNLSNSPISSSSEPKLIAIL